MDRPMAKAIRMAGTVIGVALIVVGTATGNAPMAMAGKEVVTIAPIGPAYIDFVVYAEVGENLRGRRISGGAA
jgi:hypothetical protein